MTSQAKPGWVDAVLDELRREVDDHEQRIRRIERWTWLLAGASFGGGGLGAAAVTYFMRAFGG